jgi:uncharacterized protein (TIGR02646 family)
MVDYCKHKQFQPFLTFHCFPKIGFRAVMKHIVKQPEPTEFIAWKAQANADWQPTYDDLRSDVKKVVKRSLMQEQGHLCCYCEQRLEETISHIEHFQPQNPPPQDSAVDRIDPLEYANMLCSCQKEMEKGEPRHCGNLKGNWFDLELLISPLTADCEHRFRYSADGHIQAAETNDDAATTSITRLGLNLPVLIDLRKQAIEPFLGPELTDRDFIDFVNGYLQKDSQGQFGAFWTTIRQLLKT